MKQIDAGPDDYRKQDPKTGRWLQNVDRKFCRWMSVAGLIVCIGIAWLSFRDGQQNDIPMIAFIFLMGVSSGGLFTLSLRTID